MKYYVGLDLGTTSAGWAVTDSEYALIHKRGKDLWGIREFDEAKTSVERRTKRVARRRRQREKARIGLLKYYFYDEIAKVDPDFYQRLENSKYHLEDKDSNVKGKNALFNDNGFTDKEYFDKYATIFHLRKELISSNAPHDVRLIYLALLNMFKHRGHFLNASISVDGEARDMLDIYRDFAALAEDILGIYMPSDFDAAGFIEAMSEQGISKRNKAKKLIEILGIPSKEKQAKALIECICGLEKNVRDIYGDTIGENTDSSLRVNFSKSDFEEKSAEIKNAVGEENFDLIICMKELYDAALLNKLRRGCKYLSEARVLEYEKHKKDLKLLKTVIKKYASQKDYDHLFRSIEEGTYGSYVNSVNSGGKIRRDGGKEKKDKLYKSIKKLLKDMPYEDKDVAYILESVENDDFLPIQLTDANGVIPNQLHFQEMKKILENAENYLGFLKEKDESGLTTSERILRLFSFQMPYYIGPTSVNSAKYGGNGWVVRKEPGMVLPWNIEDKIDIKATSEAFISRMVRKCTYMNDEQVMPKASLKYERYCVLNELNNIRAYGEKIPVEIKQSMYKDLFEKGKRVTKKQICDYLIGKGVLAEKDREMLTGLNDGINSTLGSFAKFKAVFGDKIYEEKYMDMAEQIIFWKTVYGDSKKLVKERIEEKYKEDITPEELKRVLGFKFKDWGKLSEEFLDLQGCSREMGEVGSIMCMLWETNDNLMELLDNKKYTFAEELKKKQDNAHKLLSELEPEDLDDTYLSAPVKRMTWQALLLLKEIEKIMGEPPARVFVEMARGGGKKNDIKDSRKKKFLELYKNIKDEDHDWKKIIEDADQNGTLRTKKMYLYLTQMGRSMYTGKEIDLDKLFNENLYDIDHIYPRRFIKDDSLENNLVLVEKEKNGHKSDNYPIEESIYRDNITLWKLLHSRKFINDEKFKRLTGREPLSDEQKAKFIERQLVETRQGTKMVVEILKNAMPEAVFVYSKAENVSDFRQKFKFLKSRNVNDFHHAQDAYLNIVVGNVYYVKFTKDFYIVLKDNEHYNISKMFEWNVKRGGETAWVAEKEDTDERATIKTVIKMMSKNTPLLTRKNMEGSGGLANETIYSAKKAKKDVYIPVKGNDEKMSDVTKYGGVTSVSTAYFILVEHTVKKKRVRSIEAVPLMWKERIEKDPEQLMVYCKECLGLVDPDIKLKKILMQSLIKKDGYYMYISGKTGNYYTVRNAVSLCLERKWINYVKMLEKPESFEEVTEEKNIELYDELTEKHLNSIFAKRPNPVGEKLKAGRERFVQLPMDDQAKVIFEILKLSRIGVPTADLTPIGGLARTGEIHVGKDISGSKEFYLINQSVTGVFEKQIDLLTV